MLRFMYSGISGLKANQTKLDVNGNNIANVGTTAFKSQRIRFSDTLSQTVRNATAPDRVSGGVNAMQVGLGVQIAGIDTLMTTGNLQPTGRPLDVAIGGNGFLLVGRGPLPNSNKEGATFAQNYTRDGSLTLDQNGNLLTSDGKRILGYPLSVTGQGKSSLVYDGGRLDSINFISSSDPTLKVPDEEGLIPMVIPDKISRNASTFGTEGTEMFQVKATTEDEKNPVKGPTIQNVPPTHGSLEKNMNIKVKKDGDKTLVSVNGYEWKNNLREAAKAAGIIEKDDKGEEVKDGDADTVFGYKVDTTKISNVKEGIWEINAYTEATDLKVTSVSIETDGVIKGVLEDGSVTALGQLAMATFKNQEGLEKLGNNCYAMSSNSGSAELRSKKGAANSNEFAYGSINQGKLEMSNVDLAEQFTDMIVASRAFQANGKVVTTGDEILQELVNLKR